MKDIMAATISINMACQNPKTLTPKPAASQANEDGKKRDEKMSIAARQRD
jgi:hypothetical protein